MNVSIAINVSLAIYVSIASSCLVTDKGILWLWKIHVELWFKIIAEGDDHILHYSI